jgi:hypothetical protein
MCVIMGIIYTHTGDRSSMASNDISARIHNLAAHKALAHSQSRAMCKRRMKAELEHFADTTAYDMADATRRRNLAIKPLDDVRQLNERPRAHWWPRLFATKRRTA